MLLVSTPTPVALARLSETMLVGTGISYVSCIDFANLPKLSEFGTIQGLPKDIWDIWIFEVSSVSTGLAEIPPNQKDIINIDVLATQLMQLSGPDTLITN
ncbi:MAG: hypothetical protein ACI9T8_000665 [Candidatus Saccharimonadales bacterium]|jgi:hypothetical protein